MNASDKQHSLARILPLYIAAYMVLLCSLGAFAATTADEPFGLRAYMLVLAGFCVSLFCRQMKLHQNVMFGILASVVAFVVFRASLGEWVSLADILMILGAGREGGPGAMLAWFVILYSFAMVSDEVIVFSVVPSIALLGLMASENLNPEIVVYFLGLVLAAVFLLVYESMLSRMVEPEPPAADANFRFPLRSNSVDHLRAPLVLTFVVLGLAAATGFIASLPLRAVGGAVSDRTMRINVPSASEFAMEASGRYVSQLDLSGAPPRGSDRVVLRVTCERPLYYRGKVFDEYTGSSWVSGSASRFLTPGDDGYWHTRGLKNDPQTGEARGREPVRQWFALVDPPISSMLVCASEPVAAVAPEQLAQDSHRCLRAADGRNTSRYEVVSLVSVASPNQLMAAATTIPATLRQTNTQLTDKGHAARLAIASRVTAGLSTEYEKVKALETYLRENFEYSLNPPRTPPGADAVEFFLTDSRVGYCEAFASAMTVLCRELGIPARLATGFAPGTLSRHRHGGLPVWILRERDLHAWTEVYFPGYGWISFDATTSRAAQVSWATEARKFAQSLFGGVSTRNVGPMVILLTVAAMALCLGKWYVWEPLQRTRLWNEPGVAFWRVQMTREERWDRVYARTQRSLKRHVGSKAASQTPFEFASDARKVLNADAADALDALTGLYVRGAFQRGGPGLLDFADYHLKAAALRKALRASH